MRQAAPLLLVLLLVDLSSLSLTVQLIVAGALTGFVVRILRSA